MLHRMAKTFPLRLNTLLSDKKCYLKNEGIANLLLKNKKPARNEDGFRFPA